MNPTLMNVGAWLLTYALHSTILLAAAALLTARLVRREAWRDTLWKAALFGGLVTATVQTTLDYRPWTGGWELDVVRSPQAPLHAGEPPAAGTDVASTGPMAAEASQPLPAAQPSAAAPLSSIRRPALSDVLLALWIAIAGALLGRLAWRQMKLRRMLRQRLEVADGALLGTLAELRRNAGVWMPVRLSASDVAPTPLALGRAEICVPPRFLDEMDRDQQRAALAHELAHLVRRDPLWHFAAAVVNAVLFFQPLNRLARRRIRESAEFLCDEWAARQTGSPLGLARCLAQVASWVAPGRHPIPAGTLAMAEGGSPLLRRVERLAAWCPSAELPAGLRVAAALAVLIPVAAMAPSVTAGRERPLAARSEVSPPVEREQAAGVASPGETRASAGVPRDSAPSYAQVPEAVGGDAPAARHEEPCNRDDDDRMAALNGLRQMDEEQAVPILRRVLARRDACSQKLRAHAVYLLAQKRTAGKEELLLGVAREDPSREVREAAVFWLAGVDTQRAVDILAATLRDSREEALQEKAVYALSQHGSAQAGLLLREAAERHPSRKVREAAIYWIGQHGAPDRAEYLRALFGRLEDPALKEKVLFSLSQTGGESRRFLLAVAEDARQPEAVRKQAIYSAGLAGVPVAELSALYDRLDERELKKQAIFALSQRGGPAVDKLIDIVRRERDGELRKSAAFWLGQSRDPRAARILSEVIEQ